MADEEEIVEVEDEEVGLREALQEAFDAVPEEVTEEAQSGEEVVQEAQMEPIPAPHSWAADAKERFAELPRDVQEVIATREKDRERDYTRKSEEIAKQRKQYEPIEQVINPYRSLWQQRGVNEAQAIQELLLANDMLARDPKGAIRFLVERTGVNPRELFSSEEQPQFIPQIAALQQQVSQLTNLHQQQQKEAQQLAEKEVDASIDRFANATDENGDRLRPYFGQVYDDLVYIAGHIRSSNPNLSYDEVLSDAYDRAIWANPNVRALLTKKQEQAISASKTAAAEEARTKAKSVTGDKTASLKNLESTGDLRKDLARAFAAFE